MMWFRTFNHVALFCVKCIQNRSISLLKIGHHNKQLPFTLQIQTKIHFQQTASKVSSKKSDPKVSSVKEGKTLIDLIPDSQKLAKMKKILKCEDDFQLFELLSKNPKLCAVRDYKVIGEKISVLLSYGISMDDIHQNSTILNSRSLKTIKERCLQVSQIDSQRPIPIKLLNQGKDIFARQFSNYKTFLEEQEEKKRMLEDWNIVESSIAEKKPFKRLSLHVLKPKIDFLIAKGFKPQEFLHEEILRRKLEKIEDSLHQLELYGLDDITPSLLDHFIIYKRIRHKPKLIKHVTEMLKDEEKYTLHFDLPKNLKRLLHLQKKDVIEQNFTFLLECGFHKKLILKLGIILGHATEVLKHHWSLLPNRPELSPWEVIQKDKWKVLNLLQYYIERENNFTQPIVFENYKTTKKH